MEQEFTIGEMIKQIRQIKDLTQDKLSELLGVSQSAIVKYEKDISKPGIDFIKAFKAITGYDLTADNITNPGTLSQ